MIPRLLPLWLVLVVLLGSCASIENTNTDEGAGFSSFRDYGWQTG